MIINEDEHPVYLDIPLLMQIEPATLLLTEAPFPTICRASAMMDMRRNSHHSAEKEQRSIPMLNSIEGEPADGAEILVKAEPLRERRKSSKTIPAGVNTGSTRLLAYMNWLSLYGG